MLMIGKISSNENQREYLFLWKINRANSLIQQDS